jgi:inhibitor of the pro-sigma K processing machinery
VVILFKELLKSILFGIIGILLLNLIGQLVNFHIPFNILNILLLGIFRLPGLVFILIFLIF